MFRRGRRMFSMASLLMILVAGLHTAGGFAAPSSPEEAAVLKAMEAFKFDAGLSMRPSKLDVFLAVWFSMGILLVVWATLNLCVAHLGSISLLRWVITINLAFLVGLDALSWKYQLPPPLLSFAVITVLTIFSFPARDQES